MAPTTAAAAGRRRSGDAPGHPGAVSGRPINLVYGIS